MSERHKDWPVRLRIDPAAFVAPGAIVVGEVAIGARSSIWFNTVVRGDSERIEIGEDTNIQDNCTVHVDDGMPAIVGHRVTVGHRAILHGCTIGDRCMIGMGALVTKSVPDFHLAIGSPARSIGCVCRCGQPFLRFSEPGGRGAGGEFTCTVCGLKYVVRDGLVTEVAPPA